MPLAEKLLYLAGCCATAPGDGVSAANAAARTLHVAKQYIQHRKGREEDNPAENTVEEPMLTSEEYLDRQPVPLSDTSTDEALGSALISAHVHSAHSNGNTVNGARINGTAVKGVW